MYRVSDEQIEFILNDIKQRGVEMEDLQLNLLDHICCILENENIDNNNFETTYQKVIKQFFKHELWEIEEETIFLLKYKNYYKMKRLLYILLFLSIGYNVFIFAGLGYDYYRHQKWMNERKLMEKVTLQEGYIELIEQLKEKYPTTPIKDYLCVSFVGDPLSELEREHFREFRDSAEIESGKKFHLKELGKLDSIAAIYNKNVTHIFAYKGSDEFVDKRINEEKVLFKNVLFVDGQKKLFSGYNNEKNQPKGFQVGYFILDKNGKIVFNCKHLINQHVFFARFLKTIPN